MYEKLKDFLTKDDPSDEELEMFLFAMNQQVVARQVLLRNIVREVDSIADSVNIFILPRLRSQRTLPDGLRSEMASTMTTMRDLGLALEVLQDECKEAHKNMMVRYKGADNGKHFRKKTNDQQG